jgi:hypothetical protein
LYENSKSDRELNKSCGFDLEKNCIFLKADCSFSEFIPSWEKFIKLTAFESSEGERSKWAGVFVPFREFFD